MDIAQDTLMQDCSSAIYKLLSSHSLIDCGHSRFQHNLNSGLLKTRIYSSNGTYQLRENLLWDGVVLAEDKLPMKGDHGFVFEDNRAHGDLQTASVHAFVEVLVAPQHLHLVANGGWSVHGALHPAVL